MKRTTPPPILAGQEFAISYPFFRGTYSEFDGEGHSTTECWEPGVRHEDGNNGSQHDIADGLGQQLITVVSTHKPGKFPERVFYTRKWSDPDGKQFGKGGLHIRSIAQFRTLTRGYRYEFELAAKEATCNAQT